MAFPDGTASVETDGKSTSSFDSDAGIVDSLCSWNTFLQSRGLVGYDTGIYSRMFLGLAGRG